MEKRQLRILILSPHHPEIVSGGTEQSAYSLFQWLKREHPTSVIIHAAAASRDWIGHTAPFAAFRSRSDEILVSVPGVDPFTLGTLNYDNLADLVESLMTYLRPEIIHMHHLLEWGLETVELFRQHGGKVVITLHDFFLICNNYGQMVKTTGELCYVPSYAECGRCFPDRSAGKFFVRKQSILAALRNVDHFVSPSRFLAGRFGDWGISPNKISIIENLANPEQGSHRTLMEPWKGNHKTIFGFFGQWNPFKGLEVLLRACALIPLEFQDEIEVRIYGENRHWQRTEFENQLNFLLERREAMVHLLGGYRNADVIPLMQDCDWIIIPSIWWENSPLVLQEARMAGCRVICSAIGGLQEKSIFGQDLTFPRANAAALAHRICEAAGQRKPSGEGKSLFSIREFAAIEKQKLEAHWHIYETI